MRLLAAVLSAVAACLVAGSAASGRALAPPANDAFANATALPSAQDAARVHDTNVGATLEPGEDPIVQSSRGGASVWYAWSAPVGGKVTIDTVTSSFDTLLGVYVGTFVGALTEITSNDDAFPDMTSAVSFDATAGRTYRIKVDGAEGASGVVSLHLHEALHPPNDDFASAVFLSGADMARTGTSNSATLEPGEPAGVGDSTGGASVWYKWTAPGSGRLRVDLAMSSFDTVVGVYTGASVGSLTEVGANDDAAPPDVVTSVVALDVTGGTTYHIRIDGYDGATGSIALRLLFAKAKPVCIVPGVRGRLLPAAKRRIKAVHCAVGAVTQVAALGAAKGMVLAETPSAGARRVSGTRVRLVVSRGRR